MTLGTAGHDGPDKPVSVMVVDDHPMWRDAVARDLAEAGFSVVATAGDGPEAVRRARAARPQVLVLDLNLPGASGVQVCKEVVASDPALRVLVLSASGEQEDVLEAVKSGATGYLLKSAGREELVDAVRRTASGDPVFTPGLAGLVLGEYRRLATDPAPRSADEPAAPRLTERETEVLRLVAKGLSYKQIAQRLVISHRTVQNHVQNTLGKLQLHNRVELVRYAIERGLDTGPDGADAPRLGKDPRERGADGPDRRF
jgi:DNA-binding NarL/FixJ family response regulator